jgi:hypothetical protein
MGAEYGTIAVELKESIAFLIAKKAPMPYISGGSPTAFDL